MTTRVLFGSGSCQVCKKRVRVRFGSFKNEGFSSVRVRFGFGSIPISTLSHRVRSNMLECDYSEMGGA